jgi:ABC-type branched-subunit amino acid transport system ATPase component
MTRLRIHNLTVHREGIRLLAGLDLELDAGIVVALVGANGSGKSALVQALAGLLDATGSVEVDGVRVKSGNPVLALSAGIALCPSDRGIFHRLSVEENLAVGGHILPRKERKLRLSEQLGRFPDLERRKNVPAGQLSGGERQQLAIARALMTKPKLLLLDEPSRGLSPAAIGVLLTTIRSVAAGGATVLVVDQALDWLYQHVDRLLIMADGKFTADLDAHTQPIRDLAEAYFDIRRP